ncbi:MAG: DUF503 domain-containing protein [Acidimicrobiia bacterium]|nr:DUF503 domain-containing protein [Acidimicrobiia bacterium]
MHACAVRFELFIPDCHSLKQKRSAVRPIVEGARRRYKVASAEVGHLDSWQRADIGVSTVAATESHVRDVLAEVERFVWSFPEVQVLSARRSWLEEEED